MVIVNMFARRKKGHRIRRNYDKLMNFESGQVQADVQFLIVEAITNYFCWPQQNYALSVDSMSSLSRIRANMTADKFDISKKEFRRFKDNVYDHLNLHRPDIDWKIVMYIEMTNNRCQAVKSDTRSEDERQSARLEHYRRIIYTYHLD